MYAVFQLSGLQYTAEEGSVLQVPLQPAEAGTKIDIDSVLMVKNDDQIFIGTPYVDGAKIEAEVLATGLSEKVRIYKYRRRTKYRRRQGHRQSFSEIRVNKIVVPAE
jgi:large subunit ribosomal protein L21